MRPAKPPALRLPRTQRSFHRPIAVSAAVHAALALLALWAIGVVKSAAPRSPGLPGPPGGGGGEVRYVELPAYHALRATDPAPAVAHLTPPTPRVAIQDVVPSLAAIDAAHTTLASLSMSDPDLSLGGAGPGSGAGVGRGGGTGSGAASGPGRGGAGGEIFPPQARYSILPPLPRPASVRGRTFRVHFWVDAAGRVTQVAVSPPIPDDGYAKQFLALMSQYTFTPALKPDGAATSGETVLTFTL
jgi:hypothetical protein